MTSIVIVALVGVVLAAMVCAHFYLTKGLRKELGRAYLKAEEMRGYYFGLGEEQRRQLIYQSDRERAAALEESTKSIFIRSTLLVDALPCVLHIASLRSDTLGDNACRWLYAMHVLGLWLPEAKDSRLLARGQFVSHAVPGDLERIIRKMEQQAQMAQKEPALDVSSRADTNMVV